MNQAVAQASAMKARALFSEGISLHQAGRIDDAQAVYRRLLGLLPGQPDALHMLGVSEFQIRNYAEAVRLISEASKQLPKNDLVQFNLGNALRALGKLDEAMTAFSKAVSLQPENLDALKNLGNLFKEQNRIDEAIDCYDRVLQVSPGHTKTLYNKAIALLMQEKLAEGWALYDSRFALGPDEMNCLGHDIPRQAPDWDGSALAKPLLVLPEQGLGDQIFYGAMLADLQDARIESFACLDVRLLPLFRRSFPGIDFAVPSEIGGLDPDLGLFGAQIHIGSLGRHFRPDPASLARVPSPFLIADPNATTSLRQRIQHGDRIVCGLSWASKNAETSAIKSLPLSGLLPVLQVPGVEFIDLQYGDTFEERQALKQTNGIHISRFDDIDNKNDIDKLAALISACDLVITVSNSTAHLAAALGKPTVILLAHHTPLWYWHLESMNTPWYPTAILLRQPAPGDWNPAVDRAAQILKGIASTC